MFVYKNQCHTLERRVQLFPHFSQMIHSYSTAVGVCTFSKALIVSSMATTFALSEINQVYSQVHVSKGFTGTPGEGKEKVPQNP